ncbi:sigma-70 family RNA polymerase sigma factor [Tautonia marina]|uniref:sigma-70 family RNA polymerase sigma factor n=1 Tax=Tautonia marina TaxID=2653855 RepID=UPI001260A5BC|nr:sigma-70 family RNA polymerase sigma factor [Tautonia marina]
MNDITRILSDIEQGDPRAVERLLPLVYDELRRLAARQLAREAPGQTLQPTALVHEAYLRLIGPSQVGWEGRGHFYAAAAEAMRRVLVDAARRRQSLRRGGELRRRELLDGDLKIEPDSDNILDLDEALTRLRAEDPRAAELVTLRVFSGMTIEEVAQVLAISPRTANRTWAYARAWLGRELGALGPEGANHEDEKPCD